MRSKTSPINQFYLLLPLLEAQMEQTWEQMRPKSGNSLNARLGSCSASGSLDWTGSCFESYNYIPSCQYHESKAERCRENDNAWIMHRVTACERKKRWHSRTDTYTSHECIISSLTSWPPSHVWTAKPQSKRLNVSISILAFQMYVLLVHGHTVSFSFPLCLPASVCLYKSLGVWRQGLLAGMRFESHQCHVQPAARGHWKAIGWRFPQCWECKPMWHLCSNTAKGSFIEAAR